MISLAEHNPELMKEWDYELNNKDNIAPETVSYGSARKVWWKCPKGHSYLMGLNSRTCSGKKKQQCSVCAGYQIIEGYNDLASKYPELIKEWNYELNNKLNIQPNNVSYGSSKKVWWTCTNGHTWNAPISRRTGSQNSGCPFCTNQKLLKSYNDLETKYPEIAKEFNVIKNKMLPSDYLYGSTAKVWWVCSNCGYEWKTAINNRTNKHHSSCPNCAPKLNRQNQLKNQIKTKGSLYDNYPMLMNEWIYEKNDKNPKDIVPGSKYKAWWKCNKCNYEWQAIVASRTTNGNGCPVCGSRIVVEGINDLNSQYPELMNEWNYEKNNELGIKPTEVIKCSAKKVWWICPICNNSYLTAISHRTHGTACPSCANEFKTSFPEQAIYYYLKQQFNNVKNRCDIIGYEADIYIPSINLAIEYDGSYYHNTKESLIREKNKYEQFKKLGVFLIRVREKDLNNTSYADYTINLLKKNNDKEIEKMICEIFDFINDIFYINSNVEINIAKDRQYIYNQYIKQIKDNSVAKLYPKILKEWDYDKNIIIPENVVPGSEKKIWFKCLKGHSYEQQLSNHIKGAGCPYCSGLKVLTGENDLETIFPDLAKEWDYEKNEIKPSEIKYGSSKKVWWICSNGHSYEAVVSHRTGNKKEKCPICSGKKVFKGYNDLKSLRPDLMNEWDFEKNTIDPENITCGSQKKAWWICPKGHSYEAVIHSRAVCNTGCPVCNGKLVVKGINDFESQQPDLLKEWDYESNNKLNIYPDKIHYHAWKNVFWICSKCNHKWRAMPGKRAEGQGCPKCSIEKSRNNRIINQIKKEGSLKDNCPELIKEWDYENNSIKPNMVTISSHKKVFWKCVKCGHKWSTEVRIRAIRKNGCPKCRKNNRA